jgi:prepilin-type processing-associated H-X9-DG protein
MQKKTLWIILGVVGGGGVLCAGCCGVGAFFAVPRIRDAAARTQSATDLKIVALAMMNYLDTNKRWPAKVEDLQPFLIDAGTARDRVQKREIEVVWGAAGNMPQPGVVIAWDTRKFGDGRNVAFMDGHVEFVTEAEFQKMPKARTK